MSILLQLPLPFSFEHAYLGLLDEGKNIILDDVYNLYEESVRFC